MHLTVFVPLGLRRKAETMPSARTKLSYELVLDPIQKREWRGDECIPTPFYAIRIFFSVSFQHPKNQISHSSGRFHLLGINTYGKFWFRLKVPPVEKQPNCTATLMEQNMKWEMQEWGLENEWVKTGLIQMSSWKQGNSQEQDLGMNSESTSRMGSRGNSKLVWGQKSLRLSRFFFLNQLLTLCFALRKDAKTNHTYLFHTSLHH